MLNWLIILSLVGSFPKAEESIESHFAISDSLIIQIVNYDQLKPLLHNDNDTTYVVNFWATWCAPCVKELPYFVALDSIYGKGPFKLILVSLDFKKDYISKLQPFVTNRELEPFVLVLEDNRTNYWIDDIDPSWSGAIPATLVYRGTKRTFFERTFHDVDELKSIVKPFLN
jgi:thiol-disulfide isomerase/thioredoxin